MGLASSQARYLTLTGRKSNLEFEAQQISHQRLNLAEQMDQIAKVYNEGIANRRLYVAKEFITPAGLALLSPNGGATGDGVKHRLNYAFLTTSIEQGGMGYRLINEEGRIVVPSTNDIPTQDASKYIANAECKDPNFLETALRIGSWKIQKPIPVDSENADLSGKWMDTSWQTDTYLSDLLYKDDDAQVEAEYTAKVSNFQRQDKALELNLKRIETDHKAVETEMDSVKKVIDKNIKMSFKTFA